MPVRFTFALCLATMLLAAAAPLVSAQVTPGDKSPGLAVGAAVAGALSWGEDEMGVSLTIAIHNQSDADAMNIVVNPILLSSQEAPAQAAGILRSNCPVKVAADKEAYGLSLPRGGSRQIRFQSNTHVEELEPDRDAAPVLLVCVSYKTANTGENHASAVLYRVLHIDPVQGVRPVDRVTGDVPAQSLKLEELGNYAN